MTAKKYLQKAYELDREANMLVLKAATIRQRLYGRGQSEGNSGTNQAGDALGATVAAVIDYENEVDCAIAKLVDKWLRIEETIKAVRDPVEREVLERRYLMYQPFESGYDKRSGEYIVGIAESMGYCERQIYRIHGAALNHINVSECQ
jgi:hypothetical protein